MELTTKIRGAARSTCESDVFADLTDKQREVLEMLVDGRTSKEIAATLGITPSAVNQRIEPLRQRLGGVTRAELARRYKLSGEKVYDVPWKLFTDKTSQLDSLHILADKPPQDDTGSFLELSDAAMPFANPPPWQELSEPRVVPEVLDGKSAGFYRVMLSVGIAIGLVIILLVLLAVSNALGDLLQS